MRVRSYIIYIVREREKEIERYSVLLSKKILRGGARRVQFAYISPRI